MLKAYCVLCGLDMTPGRGLFIQYYAEESGLEENHPDFPFTEPKSDLDEGVESAAVMVGLIRGYPHLRSETNVILDTTSNHVKTVLCIKHEHRGERYWQASSDELRSKDFKTIMSSEEKVTNIENIENKIKGYVHQTCWQIAEAINDAENGHMFTPREVLYHNYTHSKGLSEESFRNILQRFPLVFGLQKLPKHMLDLGEFFLRDQMQRHVSINHFPLAAAYERCATNPVHKSKQEESANVNGNDSELITRKRKSNSEVVTRVKRLKQSTKSDLSKRCFLDDLPGELVEKILVFTDVQTAINVASTSRHLRFMALSTLDCVAKKEIETSHQWMLPLTTMEKSKWKHNEQEQEALTGIKRFPWLNYMRICLRNDDWGMVNRQRVLAYITEVLGKMKKHRKMREDLSLFAKAKANDPRYTQILLHLFN